ncbi:MarR family transcriptional regulator [Streptomyces massasporeus]|uniref:MarR family winged helix-turn-helix transcriptional regulator n=1 Tax=Streptomyces massasporeus TaxID=67324 RepID=UPI0033B6793D
MNLSLSPLALEVLDLIDTLVARYQESYEAAAARHQLTSSQVRVLELLSQQPLAMSRLAERLKCEPSNVTGIVDRLEARGLVRRGPDPADRRVKLAAVTEAGRSIGDQVRASTDFTRTRLTTLPPEDCASLHAGLARMLN